MTTSTFVSRRTILRSALSGGAWILSGPSWASLPSEQEGSLTGLGPWLRFKPSGEVIAYSHVADIGQGTWAGLRAGVAHQLSLPFDAVHVEAAPVLPGYENPFTRNHATFGSLGLRSGLATLVPAAAAAREMLERAAAVRWGVLPSACEARAGRIWCGDRSLSFAELLQDAAQLAPPEKPTLRSSPVPPPPAGDRGRDRVTGGLRYGIDLRLPGQRYAAVQRAPRFGAHLVRIENEEAVARMRGVLKLVRLERAVAVIAQDSWAALQAASALKLVWSPGRHPRLDNEGLRLQLREAAMAGRGVTVPAPREPAFNAEATAAALAASAQTVDLLFDVPYLAHLPMEPLNATVRVAPEAVDVWVSTQSQGDTRAALARLLGRPLDQVRLHAQICGGGFGRRLEHDWVVEAAQVAAALPGVPVQLVWPRESELRAGYFRPAVAARVRIGLSDKGLIQAIRVDSANPSLLDHTGLVNGPPADSDWTVGMGWQRQPYSVPALHLTWSRVDPGIPCAYWRSVGASQNHFFYECALDVAAQRGGHGPVQLREQLLAAHPRGLAFLKALVAHGRWEQPAKPGHFRGMAMGAANGSISGHVVEIQLTGPKRFRIVDIAAAIDAGRVIDPSAVEAQMMGGTVFGLNAALQNSVVLDGGGVAQSNFHDYPMLRMADLPPLRTVIVPSDGGAGGVGEEGVPTIAPAIANALFAATGEPVTRLPLAQAGWILEK